MHKQPHVVGLLGGLGPESTVIYYREIIAAYREETSDGSYPFMVINSIDLTRMLSLIAANRLNELTEYLLAGVENLRRAGASFGLIASNTPHIVFNAIQGASQLPLLSIVEVSATEAVRRGLRRVGLFGSRFTMQASFYRDTFTRHNIEVISPVPAEQDYIHEKYMTELVMGNVVASTREGLLQIVKNQEKREHIDGVILAGTELSLMFEDAITLGPVQLLDTTAIHIRAAVVQLLSA